MKKLKLIPLLLFCVILPFTSCTKKAEKHAYNIDGDTVYVNNKICAVSGSKMEDKDLGKFISTVEYHGHNEKYKGKKFVFNQCCEMCLDQFQMLWRKYPEQIMRKHGLTSKEK